jgi:hypothetical protein
LYRRDREVGQHEAECPADDREHKAFRQHLKRQPSSSCTKGGSDRHFLFAHRGADEQQVGHVGACDQDHHTDRRQQCQQCRSNRTYELLVKRHDFG